MAIYSQPPETARPACPRCGVEVEPLYSRYWRDPVPPFWGCYACNVAYRRDDLPSPDESIESEARHG